VFLANVGPLALEAPSTVLDGRLFVARDGVGTAGRPTEFGTKMQSAEAAAAAPAANPESRNSDRATSRRRNLVQKMRDWLRRAA
jgi:hypothetical protein